ncbi:CRISPR-associated helicase Cas3' [Arcticibacter tournemirensis]|uniref:CRISPR-associated helicase Cas3 n=1 Tax=Arcticibacter tournemirensis TaxID=699437 RepID=A0A4Q0MB89_9SPHI|nr:CRISPR-associated helicase Cas3' [Arcticibacter tournemirensis]RXF70099.1 CRISPR-associated helicase Cas3' [Arcticibacter tournemirensis]
MNKHEYIKAKGNPEWTPLYDHLLHVKTVAEVFASYAGMDIEAARLGALLHDIGKVHKVFQEQLQGKRPKQTFRHELSSLFFLPLIEENKRMLVLEMIVGHHKSVCNDAGNKGILDLLNDEDDPLGYHLGDWDQWSPIALEILNSLYVKTRYISKKEAIGAWEYSVKYCEKAFLEKRGYSVWRGLLMGSDYFASAQSHNTAEKIKRAFVAADLCFFNRQHELYPLSTKSATSEKRHTIVVACTGAGKTDYLLRRCKGRIFYTLPFQASINAMYNRLKKDLKPNNPDLDIRVLHAASSLVDKNDETADVSLQELIGASVKVLTPYQLAGVAFGSKGYESIILDLKGCDVILDEVHTYSGISQAIVLKIVSVLKQIGCRVHIGTATMPTILYEKIKSILGTEDVLEVQLSEGELNLFNRHVVHKLESLDQSFSIIRRAVERKEKILIVCNRVESAQTVYEQMQDDFPQVDKLLLHSRFRRMDRNDKEIRLLGQDEKGFATGCFNTSDEACIVVSTQVVEVSLDISFDLMVTEAAPLDALIQRFGRINRKREKQTIGHLKPVYVIAPPCIDKDARPYDLEILERGFSVLPDGEVLHESELQKKIDYVFTEIDFLKIETHAVFKESGQWSIPLLTHGSPLLIDLLDIDSVVCIVESDYEDYMAASFYEKMQYEIPARYYAVKSYPRIRETGHAPFIIPNSAYSDDLGLSLKALKKVNTDDQIF